MKTRKRICSIALLLGIFGHFQVHLVELTASPVESKEVRQSLLAQCKTSTSHADVIDWCDRHSLKLGHTFSSESGLEIIDIAPNQDSEQIVAMGLESGLFDYFEPNYPLMAYRIPNDRGLSLGQTWGLQNIGQQRGLPDADIDAPEGWDYRTSAEDIIVAVIDSGIRYTHEDLVSNLWQNKDEIPNNNRDDDRNGVVDDQFGYNAVNHSGDPWDDDGHGTSVSGVIGAVGDNRVGTAGVAWKVQLMALKFLDSEGQGLTSDAISCIDYALSHGANIINASWGGNGRSRSLERAIRRAQSRNVLFVTAAGNDHANIDRAPDYPASYSLSNIITVGSSTRTDNPSSASNFGRNSVDLFAPGSQIYTCKASSDRSYGFSSGTSLAAPFVTGTLALMIAADPGMSGFELTNHLLSSVDPLPALEGLAISEGRLNLAAALSLVSPEIQPKGPLLSILPIDSTIRLQLRASPNQAFLLEATSDFTSWRSVQRVQADIEGHSEIVISRPEELAQFYRVRPLN
jgi:subtilisin family serine protease